MLTIILHSSDRVHLISCWVHLGSSLSFIIVTGVLGGWIVISAIHMPGGGFAFRLVGSGLEKVAFFFLLGGGKGGVWRVFFFGEQEGWVLPLWEWGLGFKLYVGVSGSWFKLTFRAPMLDSLSDGIRKGDFLQFVKNRKWDCASGRADPRKRWSKLLAVRQTFSNINDGMAYKSFNGSRKDNFNTAGFSLYTP